MTIIPAMRTHLHMPELMLRWGWSESALRDAIMSGRLVPSYFINKPLWPDPAPQPKQPAVSKNDWMYLLAFKQEGAVQGYFHRMADTYDALTTGNTVFKLDGNGYTKDHLINLSDVLSGGVVMMNEVTRFEAESSPDIDDTKSQWWNTEYKILEMAQSKEANAKHAKWGVNQSGPRAGKYPLLRICESIAHDVVKSEKTAGRSRTIGSKSIEKFLKNHGWA